MRKALISLTVSILLALALLPAKQLADYIERPLYTAKLTFEPSSRTLSGQLYYKLPPGDFEDIVFNVWANAFTAGKEGEFVFSQFENAVFYKGDSRAKFSIANVMVNGHAASYTVDGTRLVVTPLRRNGQDIGNTLMSRHR